MRCAATVLQPGGSTLMFSDEIIICSIRVRTCSLLREGTTDAGGEVELQEVEVMMKVAL